MYMTTETVRRRWRHGSSQGFLCVWYRRKGNPLCSHCLFAASREIHLVTVLIFNDIFRTSSNLTQLVYSRQQGMRGAHHCECSHGKKWANFGRGPVAKGKDRKVQAVHSTAYRNYPSKITWRWIWRSEQRRLERVRSCGLWDRVVW
jgi:hypothetical protein